MFGGDGRRFRVARELAERMHRELVVPSDGEDAAGERAVGDGAVEQIVGGLQTRGHRRGRGLQRHRIRGETQAVAALHGARNGDRNLSGDGDLAEKRARHGALRNVVGREFREPGWRVRETLDQIGAAERRDHDGLSRGEQLIHEGALIVGEADVAFAVGHAHEKRGDGDVVGIGLAAA